MTWDETVIVGVSLSNGHVWWRHELGISEVLKPLLVSSDTVVVDLLIYCVVSADGRWHHRGACIVGSGRRPRRGHR